MENIKETIRSNLIQLRKSNGLTQIDLSKRINYSDKAISRWENGEVVPDIEVLNDLAMIYNVSISYFFETHELPKEIKSQKMNKIAVTILYVCFIWTLSTIAYVYLNIVQNKNAWKLFILAIPLTAITILYCNSRFFKNRTVKTIFQTILAWSAITFIYLLFLKYNLWLIYIVGIPVQFLIIVSSFIKSDTKIFFRKW